MKPRWHPGLSTGDAALDAYQRELFARFGDLLDAARAGRSGEEVGRLLGFLEEYVHGHLAAEEALMERRAYPHTEAHRLEHERLAEDLLGLLQAYLSEGATPPLLVRVNGRVAAWLREHVFRADRALADFLGA